MDWDGDGDSDVFFGTAGGGEFWRNECGLTPGCDGVLNFTLTAGGLEDSSDNTHTAAFGDVHC